jgi:hypothetical protein
VQPHSSSQFVSSLGGVLRKVRCVSASVAVLQPGCCPASRECTPSEYVTETSTMDANETNMSTAPGREARSVCLVEGCPCRDARIVSHRRARFFAHLAEMNGETAQRVIRPERGWELPRTA